MMLLMTRQRIAKLDSGGVEQPILEWKQYHMGFGRRLGGETMKGQNGRKFKYRQRKGMTLIRIPEYGSRLKVNNEHVINARQSTKAKQQVQIKRELQTTIVRDSNQNPEGIINMHRSTRQLRACAQESRKSTSKRI